MPDEHGNRRMREKGKFEEWDRYEDERVVVGQLGVDSTNQKASHIEVCL